MRRKHILIVHSNPFHYDDEMIFKLIEKIGTTIPFLSSILSYLGKKKCTGATLFHITPGYFYLYRVKPKNVQTPPFFLIHFVLFGMYYALSPILK